MQIVPGIHSIGQDKGGNVHAYLLDDGQGLTLIDTLFDDDANVVLAEIAQMGRTPRDLKQIVLTHAHKSHVGGLAALKKASGATVSSHAWEVDIIAKSGDRVGPIEVVATPGHTPGCLSWWWPERRALFVGDVIATWPELAPGWPGLTLDNPQNLRSVHQLVDFGSAQILGVGHGEPITSDAAARVREMAG